MLRALRGRIGGRDGRIGDGVDEALHPAEQFASKPLGGLEVGEVRGGANPGDEGAAEKGGRGMAAEKTEAILPVSQEKKGGRPSAGPTGEGGERQEWKLREEDGSH